MGGSLKVSILCCTASKTEEKKLCIHFRAKFVKVFVKKNSRKNMKSWINVESCQWNDLAPGSFICHDMSVTKARKSKHAKRIIVIIHLPTIYDIDKTQSQEVG